MALASLHALNAFLAVARRRSFAAAARDLGVSSSALSQAVQQLEARLEVPLLRRTSRSVALTEAGARLLEEAGPGIDRALQALETVHARRDEVAGRLRLSVPQAAVGMGLPTIVSRFLAEYPHVQLDVRVENRFVDIVAAGIDAGIRLVEAIDRDMVHLRLSPATRLVVVAAPAYLARKGQPQTPAELLKHECLCARLSLEGDPVAWELERGKRTYRVPVAGPVVSNDRELLHALCRDGRGLLYGLEALVAEDLARGRLQLVLEAYASSVPGLFLYYPSRQQVSPALRAFVTVARAVMKT